MSLVERVAEAMHIEGYYRGLAQAVLETLGFVTCQTCGGKGKVVLSMEGQGHPTVTCPDCRGLGVVPSEAMIERAVTKFRKAQTDSTVMLPEFVYDGMRAALLAAFGGAHAHSKRRQENAQ